MEFLESGNAFEDRTERHWMIGHFMPQGTPYHLKDVEVKWASHKKGDEQPLRDGANAAHTISILIDGSFTAVFPDKEIPLTKRGDYIFFKGVSHGYRTLEDSMVVTVRWPSFSKK